MGQTLAMLLAAEKVINGTFGEVWLDADKVSEAYGLEASLEFNKEEITIAGKMGTDTKTMGYKGTGTVRMHHINSRLVQKISAQIKQGINPRFQILSAIKDPAAFGAERVAIKDASFDKLQLANWEVNAKGEIEAPFTFTDYDTIDTITPTDN